MKIKITFFFLLISAIVYGQTDSTDLIVQQMMKQQGIVGLSLAVIKNGRPLVNKGYGLANAELNVPVTTGTVFKIGSLSKQFIATAIMKLQDEGKLNIEDPIFLFFPAAPEHSKPIKIKHLMSHTSGLPREGPIYNNLLIQADSVVISSAYALPLQKSYENEKREKIS